MKDISSEILKLLDTYSSDIKKILEENKRLEYFYALSEIRENILEWFPFQKTDRILQMGSDYGAVTGLLAERAGHVTVADQNSDNLYVNEKRHSHRGNITFTSEKEPGAIYDYVIFIGTLKEDVQSCLKEAKKALKPGGAVILAVCNLNGIKYWSGAREDEISLTRAELKELLKASLGEGEERWYYPVPDYKTANVIYSQDYLPQKGDLTNPLPAYDYPRYLLMEGGKALDAACEGGCFEDYANSFLVIWRSPWRK